MAIAVREIEAADPPDSEVVSVVCFLTESSSPPCFLFSPSSPSLFSSLLVLPLRITTIGFQVNKCLNAYNISGIEFRSSQIKDEDVLRQFDKEVKDRVKFARSLVAESKENYDNQLKIQKLKDTIFSVGESLGKAKKNDALASSIAAKSIPKSLHCLAMRLVEERISHSEKYKDDLPKAEFEDPSLYHYALFSDNVIAVSLVVRSVVKNAEGPWKHVFHVVTDRMNVAAMKVWFRMRPVEGGAHLEVKAVEDYSFLKSSHVPVLRQIESAKMQRLNSEKTMENGTKDGSNLKLNYPEPMSMLSHLRFYLPKLYPKPQKILLLDDDVVVQKDLTCGR